MGDPSALAILDKRRPDYMGPYIYHAVHLHRYTLGTTYPEIGRHVKQMINTPQLRNNCALVIDVTGVGRPVYDYFTEAGMQPIPITIVPGNQEISDGFGGWHVPKRNLVFAIQILLSERRLKLAQALEHTAALQEELKVFQVKVTKAGNDSYEAWRDKDHDDLVLALAIACWYAERFVESADEIQKRQDNAWLRMKHV